jgi:hypothetical protein
LLALAEQGPAIERDVQPRAGLAAQDRDAPERKAWMPGSAQRATDAGAYAVVSAGVAQRYSGLVGVM